ncbi:MAG: hypothetical protein ACLQGP_17330 [Isosphaeraceae bacterium]
MRTRRSPRYGGTVVQFGKVAMLATLTVGGLGGCTREFFREWANQDVSEALFEKSRDPRWRLDTFSVEPPALSRFADPYDQDAPPAPPDDVPAEALSPVPQWPSNRLILPVEGTGYLDLFEYWQRNDYPPLDRPRAPAPPNPYLAGIPANMGVGGVPPSISSDPAARPGIAFQPYPGMANPFAPGTVYSDAYAREEETGQRLFEAMPDYSGTAGGTGGTGTPPGGGRRPATGGRTGTSTGTTPRLSPGSPSGMPPSLSPGSPPSSPPRLSPGTPSNTPGAPNPGGPGATASVPRRVRNEPGKPVVQIIRLQDDEEAPKPGNATRKVTIPPPRNMNSGTKSAGSTPISVSKRISKGARPIIPPPRRLSSLIAAQTVGTRGVNDRSVARVALQETAGRPDSMQPPANPPATNQPPGGFGTGTQPPDNQPAPPPAARPGGLDPDIQALPNVPGEPAIDRQLIDQAGKLKPSEAVGLAGILVPSVPAMNESEAAGLPKDFKAYKIDMQQAWLLALINGRYYQYQLEQLYLAALPVTLQRFAFEPQFYAGMSPTTGVPQTGGAGGGGTSIGGGSFAGGVNYPNSYSYATRFAPTGQVSTLNLGTVAGVGKLFNTGGQMLAGFASELVFNFAGKNPQQPTVLSAIPISFVQPLLRGGGRAVTLEPLTIQERDLLYAVRAFTQFRQQFFVVTLTGGSIQNYGQGYQLAGFSGAGNTDPTTGYIPAAFNVVQVEIDRRNVAFYENLVKLYQELIQGEASGLSQLQVDQVQSQLIGARSGLFSDKVTYRLGLDQFKMQMGLPPDLPMVMDQSFLGTPFYKVFDSVDAWQKNPDRKLSELPSIISRIPALQDIDLDGRSVLGIYRNYRATAKQFVPEDEDGLEDLLSTAIRIGLEYRLDLMNARATLYDSWRQIRVVANTLEGILNVTVTNNVYTGPYTTNPFAFLSQAKNFSLVLNAELPLVRMSERNNFRTALINYQRARRTLMNVEDNLKIQLRADLRNVHASYIQYEINKRNYELNVRLKDQSFEQIVAPPAGGTQSLAQSANAATQTTNLLSFQGASYRSQLALISQYEGYQTNRLIFYRDIGILPYDEWEAFSELFPSEYHGPIHGQPDSRPGTATSPETTAPAIFGR